MIDIRITPDKQELGRQAAALGAETIRAAIARHGEANIIVATGASQFEMLQHLVAAEGIDWSKVTAFHLDEYVGLPISHPASFRRYLQERFVAPLGGKVTFVPVNGEGDAQAETGRLNALITGRRIDLCFAGIGENCHLAFNDPPADFETKDPYIVVTLDEACRNQQFGEGWFESLKAVPERAISMSVHQILKSELIILSVSDTRKAKAVQHALEGEISPQYPASILRRHANTVMFIDPAAAAWLTCSIGSVTLPASHTPGTSDTPAMPEGTEVPRPFGCSTGTSPSGARNEARDSKRGPTTTASAPCAISRAFSAVLTPKPTATGSLVWRLMRATASETRDVFGVADPVMPVIET